MLSIAAPFNRLAAIPEGNVTVRDIAGLYIYDNTLLGIQFTGAQVRAYLEYSAQYFKQVSGTGPFTPDQLTNAVTPTAPNGTPDYNYDIMGGLDAPLAYDIDIAKPVGSRIKNLAYGGAAVADAEQFVVAINNYRQSGGGGFPGVTTAPVVYNAQVPITQLLIQWVTDQGDVDPTLFPRRTGNWCPAAADHDHRLTWRRRSVDVEGDVGSVLRAVQSNAFDQPVDRLRGLR